MRLGQQIKNLNNTSSYDEAVIRAFHKRLNRGRLTRDEDDKTHFCVYFLAYDPKAKEVFVGLHKKSGLWLFTGGHIDKGETLEKAVVREVWEEWGQKMALSNIDKPALLTITEINNPTKQTCTRHYDIWYFFKVDKDNFVVDNNKLIKEFHEISWKGFSDAGKLIIDPSTLKALDTIVNDL